MSGEPDSGSGGGGSSSSIVVEPPTTKTEPDCENDRVSGSSNNNSNTNNSNFEAVDGINLLRCDRCDTFETQSRILLQAHVAQCVIIGGGGIGGTGGGSSGSNSSTDSKNSKPTNNNNNKSTNNKNTKNADGDTVADTKPPTETNNRKMFECDVCNMKFSNGANMRRHKMRHTGVKPYECRICQKRFFRKDHLAEHFTTHTKTLPYHCPICNRGFQRQIAMRAHFQNEHVGQHDLVKTCPLCSFRAGTMKSLRVHFFNRHGIDLDNPGPGAPSSLLLALDPTNSGQLLPASFAAAVSAAGVSAAFSDSGDSLRSTDNVTPPMHFLTPHVEISMADNIEGFNCDTQLQSLQQPPINSSLSSLEIQPCPSTNHHHRNKNSRPNGSSPLSPHSADSNSNNIPSSSHSSATTSTGQQLQQNASQLLQATIQNANRHLIVDGAITPSISLIPIKQEPNTNDEYNEKISMKHSSNDQQMSSTSNSNDVPTPSSTLNSIIKVSPLKSLLREDLKRRICARANNRASRNAATSNSNNHNNNNNNNNNSNNNSSLTVTTESSLASTSMNVVATTSNGIITSTGTENDLLQRKHQRCLQCLYCGIEFPDQTLYFLHKGCHSDNNPWKCNICGEQLNNVYEFNSHLLSKSHQ